MPSNDLIPVNVDLKKDMNDKAKGLGEVREAKQASNASSTKHKQLPCNTETTTPAKGS